MLSFRPNSYEIRNTFTSGLTSLLPTNKQAQLFKALLDYGYVGIGAVIAGGAIWYYMSRKGYKEITLFNGLPAKIKTISAQAVEFTHIVDSAKGPIKRNTTHLLLSAKEIEEKMKDGEDQAQVNRPGNPIESWELNSLPSGNNSEDRHSVDIVNKADLKELLEGEGFFWKRWFQTRSKIHPNKKGEKVKVIPGNGEQDLMMFSVFDGHGGPNVADLLSRTLHGCLAWNIGKLFNQRSQNREDCQKASSSNDGHQGAKLNTQSLPASHNDEDSESFAEMIVQSFLAVDSDLLAKATSAFSNPVANDSHASPHLPPHSPVQLALSSILGRWILCYKLYVANVGDTRAVAGWWNPQKGQWRCDVLTADATCENEQEAERIRNEHPEDERETAVYDRGKGKGPRILGGLQPSRAFGDHDYKLKYNDFKGIHRALCQKRSLARWEWFEKCPNKTPPYVTAKPDVVLRDIHPESGEELKFVVLATDGLWHRVTSEEASYLLAAHMIHQIHPDVPKTQITALCPHTTPLPEGEHPYPKEEMNLDGKWVFEDVNAATHLIRNGLGGGDRELRRQFLSLRQPGVRSARDDTTAMVIWFDKPVKDVKNSSDYVA